MALSFKTSLMPSRPDLVSANSMGMRLVCLLR